MLSKNEYTNLYQILCKKLKCSYALNFEQKRVYKWYKLYAKSREDVNEDGCLGRTTSTPTSDENVGAVNKIVIKNHRLTIREITENVVGINEYYR